MRVVQSFNRPLTKRSVCVRACIETKEEGKARRRRRGRRGKRGRRGRGRSLAFIIFRDYRELTYQTKDQKMMKLLKQIHPKLLGGSEVEDFITY